MASVGHVSDRPCPIAEIGSNTSMLHDTEL
jgi:hypothetical protein